MFEARSLVFYYAVSPVHMGAGSAIGAIDSPIQREVHTKHPMFAGSGIKGALRHHLQAVWGAAGGPGGAVGQAGGADLVRRIFGPDTGASDFAGALAMGDAQLVALPVRSMRGGFAYATSPVALGRLKRLAQVAGLSVPWNVPTVPDDKALVAGDTLLVDKRLVLEAFEFDATQGVAVGAIGAWLAQHAFADPDDFFARKLASDLIVLSDTDLSHFARHAMVVEPHVRIDDETGTADDGGLFFVENLPPETLMAGLAHASVERRARDDRAEGGDRLSAQQVLSAVFDGDASRPGVGGKPLQIGGDATSGRGVVLVKPAAAR